MKKNVAFERMLSQKKEADAFWDKVKCDPEYLGAAMTVCNEVDKKILLEEQRARDKKILEDFPDYDPDDPITFAAEVTRQRWIKEFEDRTGKTFERILGHKPTHQFTGGPCVPKKKPTSSE